MNSLTESHEQAKVRLDSLAAIDPESLPTATKSDFTFTYIDITSVNTGRLNLPDVPVSYGDAPSRARRRIRTNDVLMSTVRPNLKAFAYCQLPDGPFVASTGFAVLRPIIASDGPFIFYSILSDEVGRQIEAFTVGSNYPAINSSDVRRLLLPAFERGERSHIGEILVATDREIVQTEELIEKYQQIKTGLMHDLFTRGLDENGQLRPPREEAPELYKGSRIGNVPKEWDVELMGSLLFRIIDYRGKTPTKTPAGIPLITARNVRIGYIDREPEEFIAESDYQHWMTRGIPQIGDVLFTMEAPLGNVAQIETSDRLAFAQRVIILEPNEKLCSGFLKFALMFDSFQRLIRRLATGTTALGIKQSEFRTLPLAYPRDIEEQKRILRRLKSAESYVQEQEQCLIKLEHQKRGLMEDLLSGRKPVSPASSEREVVGV